MTATTEWFEAAPVIDQPPATIYPLESVRPLMATLTDSHGPTNCLGATMNAVAPFPRQVASLADASLLDLALRVNTPVVALDPFEIAARARYATSASIAEAFAFYCEQFQCAGVVVDTMITPADGGIVNFDVLLTGDTACSYGVEIHDLGSYRAVVVQASYEHADAYAALQHWGTWHGGAAPIDDVALQAAEVMTVAGGPNQPALAVLTSHYDLDVPVSALRSQVDQALVDAGWTTSETVPGVLFLDGPFDAEVHVTDHRHGSRLSFVGEFTL